MATEGSNPGEGWPSSRWQLSAPESYVLQNGPSASGREAFKVALVELVARGSLVLKTVEGPKPLLGRAKDVSVLVQGGKAPPPERPLGVVHELLQRVPETTFRDGTRGVPVEKLAEAARKRYGAIGRYVAVDVLPSLVMRGLYARETYKVLLIFSRERYVPTPSGEQAKLDLERWMGVGKEQLSGLVDQDPTRALAYLGLAGAGVLLMSDSFPDLQRLRDRVGSSDGDVGSTSWIVTTGGSDDDRLDLDFGGLDLSGMSLDFDLSAFDSLDSAFDAIDSGVDAGGGSDSGRDGGGGDRGGGDGGGGGGGD